MLDVNYHPPPQPPSPPASPDNIPHRHHQPPVLFSHLYQPRETSGFPVFTRDRTEHPDRWQPCQGGKIYGGLRMPGLTEDATWQARQDGTRVGVRVGARGAGGWEGMVMFVCHLYQKNVGCYIRCKHIG